MSGFAPEVALDALFRRNVSARGSARALLDLDGTALTYAETANAVATVAEQIALLGLPPRSMIALVLPNGRELVVALLAAMRSGHVAVPMSVAWRKPDLVRACREAEAAALITTANFRAERLPELAAEVAIEVFELSFPCAFGTPLPEGLVSLPFAAGGEHSHANAPLPAAVAPGIGTLQPARDGVSLVVHRDEELLAAGLGAMLACNVQSGDSIVSAVAPNSLAGLATAIVPWLLSGGTLTLLPDLPGRGALAFDEHTHLIGTTGALASLCAIDPAAFASAAVVHFAGTQALPAFSAPNARLVVDVIALGEFAAIALPRREPNIISPLPLGRVQAGNAGAGSPVIVETSVDKGQISVRGAMVPRDAIGDRQWLDTGFGAVAHDAATYVTPPKDLLAIGALRFDFPDIERRILSAAPAASVYAVNDPILGTRLVVTSESPEETKRALADAGLPRLIANAVQKAETAHAKMG